MASPGQQLPIPLSVVIMVKDEETNLPRTLASVQFADEVIVADTGSTDRTIEIAESAGARVVRCHWRGFGPTKAEALLHASGEWILSLDADEVVSSELAASIRTAIAADDSPYVAYKLDRHSNFLGRWMKHSGWYPDYVTRLFRKGRAKMSEKAVHESLSASGAVGRLAGRLLHYTDPTVDHYLTKMKLYTRLSARELFEQGRKCRWTDLPIRPAIMFLKTYIVKQGFRDGWQGFVLAMFSSMHVFTKYARLRALWAGRNVERPGKQDNST